MASISVLHKDESFVRIVTDSVTFREIYEYYSFFADGYRFMPAFKLGKWDGKIRLVDFTEKLLPKGLISSLCDFCDERGHRVSIDKEIVLPLKSALSFDWSTLKLRHEPRDFQVRAVEYQLKHKRMITLSSTGSGKSLIIYASIRSVESLVVEARAMKILLIVPSVSLVNQMVSDFENYSVDDVDWSVDKNVHKIFSGEEKHSSKSIYVTTYQSMLRMPEQYFLQFGAVLFDEVHTCAGAKVSAIMNLCRNAFFRFGYTGTLKESKTNELQMQALFGRICRVSETRDLMDRKILAELKIKSVLLSHDGDIVDMSSQKGWNYQKELMYLVSCPQRNKAIVSLVGSREKNTLVLVQYVKKHGDVLQKMLRDSFPEKEILFVTGDTEAEIREEVRHKAETQNNVIIVASYSLFQQGISINNLHNIVFASPSKSKIRVLQSIGRGLRLHKDKEFCCLYDIGDDLRGKRQSPNLTLRHYVERYQYYLREKFDVELIQKTIYT